MPHVDRPFAITILSVLLLALALPPRSTAEPGVPCLANTSPKPNANWVNNPVLRPELKDDFPNCRFHQLAWENFLALIKKNASGENQFQLLLPVQRGFPATGPPAPMPVPGQAIPPLLGELTREAKSGVPLIAQIGTKVTTVQFGERMNAPFRDYIARNALHTTTGFANLCERINAPVEIPAGEGTIAFGALEIKTAWIELEPCDPSKYVCTTAANGLRYGLVGFHLVQKLSNHQEWIWATFEHVANAPDCRNLNQLPPRGFSQWHFFNGRHRPCSSPPPFLPWPRCNQTLCEPPCNVFQGFDSPANVCRLNPIASDGTVESGGGPLVITLNESVHNALPASSALRNYVLVGTLWMKPGLSAPAKAGAPTPVPGQSVVGSTKLSNTTMETFTQNDSCFFCHTPGRTVARYNPPGTSQMDIHSSDTDLSHIFRIHQGPDFADLTPCPRRSPTLLGRCTNNDSACLVDAECMPSAACCGNGIVTAPETCDDGNAFDGDACTSACEAGAPACRVPFTGDCRGSGCGDADGQTFVLADTDGNGFCEWPSRKTVVTGALTFPPEAPIEFRGKTKIEAGSLVVEPGARLVAVPADARTVTLVTLGGDLTVRGALDLQVADDLTLEAKRGSLELVGPITLRAADRLTLEARRKSVTIAPPTLDPHGPFTVFGGRVVDVLAKGTEGSVTIERALVGSRKLQVSTRSNSSRVGEKTLRIGGSSLLTTSLARTGLERGSVGDVRLDGRGTIIVTDAMLDSGRNVRIQSARRGDDLCLANDATLFAQDNRGRPTRIDVRSVRGRVLDDGTTTFHGDLRGTVELGTCDVLPAPSPTLAPTAVPTPAQTLAATPDATEVATPAPTPLATDAPTGEPPALTPVATPVPTVVPTPPPAVDVPTWRFYARIQRASGSAVNVNVPLRGTQPPVAATIQAEHVDAFELDDRMTSAEIAALGGDTLQRLMHAVDAYVRSHPEDYPNSIALLELRWAKRVGSLTLTPTAPVGSPAKNIDWELDCGPACSNATINVGDTVQWTVGDSFVHTVTSSAGPVPVSSGDIDNRQPFQFTFNQAGTWKIYCVPHGPDSMGGTIIVQ